MEENFFDEEPAAYGNQVEINFSLTRDEAWEIAKFLKSNSVDVFVKNAVNCAESPTFEKAIERVKSALEDSLERGGVRFL